MKPNELIQISLLLSLVSHVSCWVFYTSLKDYTFTGSHPDPKVVHSDYIYGGCKNRRTLKLHAHVHKDAMEVLGKIIIREWLNIYRIPTCVILRATSYEEYALRSTSYNFQMCTARISYCHTHMRIKYYYYEWYIPDDFLGGMDWDIYFFGPESPAW